MKQMELPFPMYSSETSNIKSTIHQKTAFLNRGTKTPMKVIPEYINALERVERVVSLKDSSYNSAAKNKAQEVNIQQVSQDKEERVPIQLNKVVDREES